MGYALEPVNTPGHAVLNLALLGRERWRGHASPILAGAIVPDLPILGFYLIARLGQGLSEAQIWTHEYFRPGWQSLFDLTHSLPLALLGFGVAGLLRKTGAQLFFASLGLHALLDLPLHREDAHRHFWPFSDLRVTSPVSYWDPAHHGAQMALLELGLVCVASVVLWRRYPTRASRIALVAVNALYVAGYALFYRIS